MKQTDEHIHAVLEKHGYELASVSAYFSFYQDKDGVLFDLDHRRVLGCLSRDNKVGWIHGPYNSPIWSSLDEPIEAILVTQRLIR